MKPCIVRNVSYVTAKGKPSLTATIRSYLGEVERCDSVVCHVRLITGKSTTALRKEIELISRERFNRLSSQYDAVEMKQVCGHPHQYDDSSHGTVGQVYRIAA